MAAAAGYWFTSKSRRSATANSRGACATTIAASLSRMQQAHHDPDKLYADKVHMTRLLFKHRWRKTRIMVLLNVVNWMMTLPETYHHRYLRAISRLEKEHDMRLYNQLEQTIIDNGIKIGLKQGMEKGLEKGLERGVGERLAARTKGRRGGAAGATTGAAFRAVAPSRQQEAGQGRRRAAGSVERCAGGRAIAQAGVSIRTYPAAAVSADNATGTALNSGCFITQRTQNAATPPKIASTLPLYSTIDLLMAGSGELFAIT